MCDREAEIEREMREIERGESKRAVEIPYVMVLFSPQKIAIFSVISFLDISKKEFRTGLLTVGRPIIRAF